MNATDFSAVNNLQRGQAIARRRIALGIHSVNEFKQLTGVSRNAITAVEEGRGSENSRIRLEAWLDRREEESGYEPGEVLRAAESRDAEPHQQEVPVIEFVVDGPTENRAWKVTVRASPGHGDEAATSVRKLIHGLVEELGEAHIEEDRP